MSFEDDVRMQILNLCDIGTSLSIYNAVLTTIIVKNGLATRDEIDEMYDDIKKLEPIASTIQKAEEARKNLEERIHMFGGIFDDNDNQEE